MATGRIEQRTRCLISSVLLVLVALSSLQAGRRAEDDFWSSDGGQQLERTGLTPFPGESFVEAGLMGYANFGGSKDSEYTVGLKISASFRDYFEYLHFRLDGFLGIDGPAEGLVEAELVLLKGLKIGLGTTHTKRNNLSPRLGLYVEDQSDLARRGGIYFLDNQGGGLEINWPLSKDWNYRGDFGVEKEHDEKYTRLLLGVLYHF